MSKSLLLDQLPQRSRLGHKGCDWGARHHIVQEPQAGQDQTDGARQEREAVQRGNELGEIESGQLLIQNRVFISSFVSAAG